MATSLTRHVYRGASRFCVKLPCERLLEERSVLEYVASIPYRQGAAEIIAWYESHPNARNVDERLDQLLDTMVAAYEAVGPHPLEKV
jgi:Lon protease-like protein